MKTFEQIEAAARHVKLVAGNGDELVADGEITRRFVHVPLGGSAHRGSWMKIRVRSNSIGGPAVVEVTDNLDRVYKLKPKIMEDFNRGHRYFMLRRDDKPAFKAV